MKGSRQESLLRSLTTLDCLLCLVPIGLFVSIVTIL